MLYTASYLTRSRHGVFYLRYPMPCALHPLGKRDYIRLSLGTREPKVALDLTAMLRYAGSLLVQRLKGSTLRYVDKKAYISQHFDALLERRKAELLDSGPLGKKQIEAIEAGTRLWRDLEQSGHDGNWTPDEATMLQTFKQGGFDLPAAGEGREQLIRDWNQANARTAQQLSEFSAELRSPGFTKTPVKPFQGVVDVIPQPDTPSIAMVMAEYVKEKTPTWKKATRLSYSRFQRFLLEQAGKDTPIGQFTVHMARKVKDALVDVELGNRTRNEYIS